MSTTDDTVPAAETESAEPASIDALIADRHQALPEHEAHREVGAEAEPAPAVMAAPAVVADPTPAPAAETKPIDPAAMPEKEQPFWYRQEAKKLRQRAEAAERDLEAARQRGAPPPQPGDDDQLDQPLTRREMMVQQQRFEVRARVERSADFFIEKHGHAQLEEVQGWLLSKEVAPNDNPMERWALSQRNPWAAAYEQYQREKIADEIGSDPAAYRAKLEESIRAEYEAKEAARQSAPAPPAAPTMQRRDPPPPAASTVRSAPPRDETGKFTGAQPLSSLTKHNYG